MIQTMRFGETRRVRITVYNIKNEPFEIVNASFVLSDSSGIVIDRGAAGTIDHTIEVLITPPARGDYTLEYSFQLGIEQRVVTVEVRCI